MTFNPLDYFKKSAVQTGGFDKALDATTDAFLTGNQTSTNQATTASTEGLVNSHLIPAATVVTPYTATQSNQGLLGSIVFDPNTYTTQVLTGTVSGQNSWHTLSGHTTAGGSLGSVQRSETVLTGKDGKSVKTSEIIDFMDVMKKRMLIITPQFELHAKYPSLKEAYETYILMEALLSGDQPDEAE